MHRITLRTESRKTQSDQGDLFCYTQVSPENIILGHMEKSLVNLQYRETPQWQKEHLVKQHFLEFRIENIIQHFCI